MIFCLTDLVGLSPDDARKILAEKGINNVCVVYNLDRKQTNFDKEYVTAVRQRDGVTELVVCRYLFAVQ